MSLENISTLEKDIAEEMKAKEATARTIASASGDVSNKNEDGEKPTGEKTQPSKKPFIFLGGALVVVSFAVGFGYLYLLQQQQNETVQTQTGPSPQEIAQRELAKKEAALSSISPILNNAIGSFVNKVSRTERSFTLHLSNFAPVFAYIAKNEREYVEEVAKILGVSHDTQDIVVAPPSTPQNLQASTSKKESSKGIATSSQATTTNQEVPTSPSPQIPIPFTYSDITVNNQNIRVITSGRYSFYYAFIGSKALVFATNLETLFAEKNVILR
jgi:hypothetical protein